MWFINISLMVSSMNCSILLLLLVFQSSYMYIYKKCEN